MGEGEALSDNEGNDQDQRGERIGRLELRQAQKVYCDHDHERTADTREFFQKRLAHQRLQPARCQGEDPLVDQDRQRGEGNPDSHCRREHDCHEPVHH